MPLAAGFVGIIPALGLLEEDKDGSSPIQLSWIAAVLWSCAVAYFGFGFLHYYHRHGLFKLTFASKGLHVSPASQTSGTALHHNSLYMQI